MTWRFSEIVDKYDGSTKTTNKLEVFIGVRENQLAGLEPLTVLLRDSEDTYLSAFSMSSNLLPPWFFFSVIINGSYPQGG